MIPRLRRWSIGSLFGFRPRAKSKPARVQGRGSAFHAVSIVYGGPDACREARSLARHRFLAREAPALPLAGCGSAACACRYAHHDDRRIELRRACDEWRAEPPYAGAERRLHRGRRRRDLAWA